MRYVKGSRKYSGTDANEQLKLQFRFECLPNACARRNSIQPWHSRRRFHALRTYRKHYHAFILGALHGHDASR